MLARHVSCAVKGAVKVAARGRPAQVAAAAAVPAKTTPHHPSRAPVALSRSSTSAVAPSNRKHHRWGLHKGGVAGVRRVCAAVGCVMNRPPRRRRSSARASARGTKPTREKDDAMFRRCRSPGVALSEFPPCPGVKTLKRAEGRSSSPKAFLLNPRPDGLGSV